MIEMSWLTSLSKDFLTTFGKNRQVPVDVYPSPLLYGV